MGPVKTRVLFLCVHNSARSQMGEAYLKKFGGDRFHAESAGLEPGKLNPQAVEAMKLDGIDISKNTTDDVNDFFRQGKSFDVVITVCDKEASDRCPVFPGMHRKINWSFEDPSALSGTTEERLNKTLQIRDRIREAVLEFVRHYKESE